MTFSIPYFMKDEDWFIYDYEAKMYYLTDAAPEKARESYNAFITTWKKPDEFYGLADAMFYKWSEKEELSLDARLFKKIKK